MSGHASRHGVNAELHIHAPFAEGIIQFPDLVLRLRNRHTVARNDYYGVSCRENGGGFFRCGAVHRPLFLLSAGGNLDLAEGPKHHVRKRPVHGLAHDHGKDETGRTIERSSND